MSTIDQEIADQPHCWERAAAHAARVADRLPEHGARIAAVGCGTSYYVAQAYAAIRESTGAGETDAFPASEMPVGRQYDGIVVITRSGTTSEVLELVAHVRPSTALTAITAVPGSPIADAVPQTVLMEFADEDSVVQTKFATSTLALLRSHLGEDVTGLVRAGDQALQTPLPLDVGRFDHYVFVGRRDGAALANEAALKMCERGGAWSNAYSAMEFRHGPISSLDDRSAVLSLGVAPDGLSDQVRATGAAWVEWGQDPMVGLVVAQRLGVAYARAHGADPAFPKYLTRSVILPA